MNKIQEEHLDILNSNDDRSVADKMDANYHNNITIKHMGKFLEWVTDNYWCDCFNTWGKLGFNNVEDNRFTTEQLIEEYIKTL